MKFILFASVIVFLFCGCARNNEKEIVSMDFSLNGDTITSKAYLIYREHMIRDKAYELIIIPTQNHDIGNIKGYFKDSYFGLAFFVLLRDVSEKGFKQIQFREYKVKEALGLTEDSVVKVAPAIVKFVELLSSKNYESLGVSWKYYVGRCQFFIPEINDELIMFYYDSRSVDVLEIKPIPWVQ